MSRSIIGLLGGSFLAGLLAVAAPGVIAPSAEAATIKCPRVQLFGVRGSGETVNNYYGYGRTVYTIIQQAKALMGSDGVNASRIDYPAIAVGYGGIQYLSKYDASVEAGKTALKTAIDHFTSGSCGTTSKIAIVGYSQGAHVAGDVYQARLTAVQREKVIALTLIGDPRFKGSAASPPNFGDFSTRLNGVYDVSRTARVFSSDQYSRVRSYCVDKDPVCNFSSTNVAVCKAAGNSCVHSTYFFQDFANKTYTQWAAAFIAKQADSYVPVQPTAPPASTKQLCVYSTPHRVSGVSGIQAVVGHSFVTRPIVWAKTGSGHVVGIGAMGGMVAGPPLPYVRWIWPRAEGGWHVVQQSGDMWIWVPGLVLKRSVRSNVVQYLPGAVGEGLALDRSGKIWVKGSNDVWHDGPVLAGAVQVTWSRNLSPGNEALTEAGTLYFRDANGSIWRTVVMEESTLGGINRTWTAPTRFGSFSRATELISDGIGSTIVRSLDGSVWTWADYSNYVYAGDGTLSRTSVPRKASITDVAQVAAAFSATVALRGGIVYTWGYDSLGILGRPHSGAYSLVPGQVGGLDSVSSVWAANGVAFAVRGGALYTWGRCGTPA